jgi:hypothetical protein
VTATLTAPDEATANAPLPLWVDGVWINPETGEILDIDDEGRHQRVPFVIDSMERLEWTLERFSNREAAIIALELRRKAFNDNMDGLIAIERRGLDGLHRRFDAEIESYVRGALAATRGAGKTLKTAFGAVSFRVVAASHRIANMPAAVEWARAHAPHLIHVKEHVAVSEIVAEVERPGYDGMVGSSLVTEFVETSPGGERMYLRTGVAS